VLNEDKIVKCCECEVDWPMAVIRHMFSIKVDQKIPLAWMPIMDERIASKAKIIGDAYTNVLYT
jgi:hypothetical protein